MTNREFVPKTSFGSLTKWQNESLLPKLHLVLLMIHRPPGAKEVLENTKIMWEQFQEIKKSVDQTSIRRPEQGTLYCRTLPWVLTLLCLPICPPSQQQQGGGCVCFFGRLLVLSENRMAPCATFERRKKEIMPPPCCTCCWNRGWYQCSLENKV